MTPDALMLLATGYWPAAALIAAVELGVFEALADGPQTAVVVADRAGADASRTAALLDALAAIDVLAKADGAYAIAPVLSPLLSRASPTCLLDALAYNGDLYRQWAGLAGVVRGTVTPGGGPQQLGQDPARTRRFVLGMDAKARVFAPALAAAMNMAGVRTLLDVGAGPGTLSRLLAERSPTLAVTLLDLPPVLDVARDVCAASPAADRLTFRPADYRHEALPGGFDAVLYAGALHQETVASAARLFENLCQALRPGGRAFVVDLMLDDGRTSPAFSALFQLNMLLLRPGSRVFEARQVGHMLAAAGFADVRGASVRGTPYHLLAASRPA